MYSINHTSLGPGVISLDALCMYIPSHGIGTTPSFHLAARPVECKKNFNKKETPSFLITSFQPRPRFHQSHQRSQTESTPNPLSSSILRLSVQNEFLASLSFLQVHSSSQTKFSLLKEIVSKQRLPLCTSRGILPHPSLLLPIVQILSAYPKADG